jgi:Predicted endonuclease containing a URI domain
MAFWVYMLRCRDGSYYAGHTDNLERRIAEHDCGTIPCYTHDRRPLHLVFSQDFATREEALAMERRLKGWSRAKKEALIDGSWEMINRLGRGKHAHQQAKSA